MGRSKMSSDPAAGAHDILLEVALQFGRTLDLDTLLDMVLERVVTLLGAERALFALLDARQDVVKAVARNLPWTGAERVLPISQQVFRRVVVTREPIMISVPELPPDSLSASIRVSGLRAIVAVPVQVRDRLLGILYVDSQFSVRADMESQRDTLRALASLVGMAVENARLFEEQRYRRELLAEMVHNFRTPSTVIACGAAAMVEYLDSPATLREISREIEVSSARINSMIDQTLALSRLDAEVDPLRLAAVDVNEIAREHAQRMGRLAEASTLRIVVDDVDAVRVETDPDQLRIVFENLLFNAIKYAAPDSAISVGVMTRKGPGPTAPRAQRFLRTTLHREASLRPLPGTSYAEVVIHNRGREIPAAVRGQLFTPYARGEVARGHASSGLGLAIVDRAVQRIGGQVWVESSDQEGTRFHVAIPIAAALVDGLVAR